MKQNLIDHQRCKKKKDSVANSDNNSDAECFSAIKYTPNPLKITTVYDLVF